MGGALAGIAAGPDGNIWFTGATTNRIGRITVEGTVTSFDGTAAGVGEPGAITPGADGALWFTNVNNRIGRIAVDGAITTYDTNSGHVRAPFGITLGPDGNVWFTSMANDRLGVIQPS
jgi:virginiamycin B lyase